MLTHLYLGQFDPSGVKPVDEGKIILWGVILIAVVLVGFGGIVIVKRILKSSVEKGDDGGFSLAQLKELRNSGEITIQEYERTKSQIIAKVKANMKRDEERRSGTDELGEKEET